MEMTPFSFYFQLYYNPERNFFKLEFGPNFVERDEIASLEKFRNYQNDYPINELYDDLAGLYNIIKLFVD